MTNGKSKIIVESTMEQPKEALVAEYKSVFQQLINMRPSGTRNKIAQALGANKSFVSQITNPSYSVPIPAKHLETIFDVCHFSLKEKEAFLQHYTAAHPNYHYRIETNNEEPTKQTKLVLDVPVLSDPLDQGRVEELVRDFARQVFNLMQGKNK